MNLPIFQSCVGSWFCCHQAPCPFGSWDEEKHRCVHLVEITANDEIYPRFGCGIYEQIIKLPGAEVAPAFGAGCCSSLFNPDREAIKRENEERHGDPFVAPAGHH